MASRNLGHSNVQKILMMETVMMIMVVVHKGFSFNTVCNFLEDRFLGSTCSLLFMFIFLGLYLSLLYIH